MTARKSFPLRQQNGCFRLWTCCVCLISSQVPSSLLVEDNMLLMEIHQVFLRHCWPYHNKLGESHCLTAYPINLLFSKVSNKRKKRNFGVVFGRKRVVVLKRNNNKISFTQPYLPLVQVNCNIALNMIPLLKNLWKCSSYLSIKCEWFELKKCFPSGSGFSCQTNILTEGNSAGNEECWEEFRFA